MVKDIGSGIAGDINIRPAIVVIVGDDRCERIMTAWGGYSALLRDIDESSVAFIPIEKILSGRQSARAAHDRNSFPHAKLTAAFGRSFIEVEVDIVGDKEVQVSVPVIIQKSAARAPACRFEHQPGALRDIDKTALSGIPVKVILSEIGHEQIIEAVIIIIGYTRALAPARPDQVRLFCHISEFSYFIIAIEVISGFLPLRETFESGAVDQENIEPAIVVVVEERDTTAGHLENKSLLSILPSHMPGCQSCPGRDILKLNLGKWDVDFRFGRLTRWAFGNGHSLGSNTDSSLNGQGK